MKFILSIFAVLIFLHFCSTTQTSLQPESYFSAYEQMTLSESRLPVLMPYNRWIDPGGEQIYFGDAKLENHALDCALSPDGKWLAVEGRYALVIIDPLRKEVVKRYPLKEYFGNENILNTYSGIYWQLKEDKYQLYWGTASRRQEESYVIQAEWDGQAITIANAFSFKPVANAKSAIPNEVLVREEQNKMFLYVVLNGNDRIEKIDLKSGELVWSAATGVAPFGIASANGKIYVSNWAGSNPDAEDRDVAGVPWSKAKVDPFTGATREGTVSVYNPVDGNLIKEVVVGLHPNDIISSPDEKYIYVANANSDIVSVINTTTDRISETISVRLSGIDNPYFGDSPNGLAISENGRILYVANGMDNALAKVELGQLSSTLSEREKSAVKGFIPTGAYPGAISIFRDSLLFIANIEAEGARTPSLSEKTGTKIYNSHRMMASVSAITVPDGGELDAYTTRVKNSNQLFRLALTAEKSRSNVEPLPLPLRIGEPSLFKHVVYIIKENRTYDQVLGDMEMGEGDTSLCVFGRNITPNTHKLCEEFVLLDNFYASGKCSAEGHQWTDASIVTDYIQKSVRAWFRSYPHVQTDALVYAPTGFLWDNALRHGKTVRIYGEASYPEFDDNLTWTSIYQAFLSGKIFDFKNMTTIKSVEPILSQTYPAYDNHKIPDVLRAHTFIAELQEYEKLDGDQWPQLLIVALPNDHTYGTRPGFPTPRAMVADNDRALGQIVEAISKSKFWKNTVIFVTEDDSQAGWDHISAYRTVGMVISPYSKIKQTIHTNYNQPSMIRTIEQILGMSPMNIEDATAMPMFDCFEGKADFSAYQALPNQIPLDEMNQDLSQLDDLSRYFAEKSLDKQFDGIDTGDDALFNRIIWYAMKGDQKYPEEYSGADSDED